MKYIKEFWKWILGTIAFFVGLVWFMNSNSSKKVRKIKKSIKDNKNKTKEVDRHIENIQKEKQITKKKIKKISQDLKKIKKKKPKFKKRTGKQATNALTNRLKKK